jgi:hypothetical protein
MIRNKARTKGDAKWNGPFIVHKLHDRGVVVTLADGKLMPYHESDVKRFKVPVIADHPSGREFVGDIAEEAVERTILGLRFGLFRRISLLLQLRLILLNKSFPQKLSCPLSLFSL